MRQLVWHHVLIILVAVIVLFSNLGGARLWDQDEPRNAGCALEMLMRGDWIVPIFNNEIRDAKPVLLYWLIMSAYTVFGVNEFAARFWSAALAVGTVVATYHIGRRLFNAQAAFWSAIILSTSFMFDVAGRAATPDSVLIFCSTIALMIFVLGTFKPRYASNDQPLNPQPRSDGQFFPIHWPVVALMYAVMGLGILAKGPVGFVIPTAVIGMFLLIVRLPKHAKQPVNTSSLVTLYESQNGSQRTIGIVLAVVVFILATYTWRLPGLLACLVVAASSLLIAGRSEWLTLLRPFAPWHFLKTCFVMRPITAIVVVLAVAAPWFLLVGLKTEGDFLRAFFINEHFGRATTAMENHDGTPLYYPVAILAGFLPWSVFMAPMLIGLVNRIRRRDAWSVGYIFLACWVCVYVGAFTLASTKLPSYVTPCYPALALMTGCFVYHWTRGTSIASQLWTRLAIGSWALVGLLFLVGIPIAAVKFLPGDEWLGVVGLIPIVGAAGCFWLMRRGETRTAAGAFAITSVAFATTMFGFVTAQVDRHQQNHVLLDTITRHSTRPHIASYCCLEPTWVFYGQQPIRGLKLSPERKSESPSNSVVDRLKPWHRQPPVDVLTHFERHEDAFVITTDRHLQSLAPQLPRGVEVLATVQHFLKKDRLVLLGRPMNAQRNAKRQATSRNRR